MPLILPLLFGLLLGLMALAITPAAWLPWWLDNLANFQLLWLALALVVLPLLFWCYGQRAWLGVVALLVTSWINFSPYLPDNAERPPARGHLSFLQFNLNYYNADLKQIIRELPHSDFDLLLLQEANGHHKALFAELLNHYPYPVGMEDDNRFPAGMALFSRWPIVAYSIEELGFKGGAIVSARLLNPETQMPVQVLMVHPSSPRSEQLWQHRNRLYQALAERVQSHADTPLLVAGDFNASFWSPYLREFVRETGLNTCLHRQNFLVSWAWRNSNEWLELLTGTQLDQCFINNQGISVLSRQIEPLGGSDHRAIATRLGLH